jgi:hypothetical protein
MEIGYMANQDEFEKMHAKLTPAEIKLFSDDLFKDNDDSHLSSSASKIAPTPFVPTIINYNSWVLYTNYFIRFAMNQMKTQDGLLALYNKIQEHYNKIQAKIPNQAKISKPPDETTTDFPIADILSDANYEQITDETALVSHLSYCLSSLDLMCQALYSSNNDIYNNYIKILSGWLRMIYKEYETRQQPPSKKGGKSRRRHRKTKRKPYSRRR